MTIFEILLYLHVITGGTSLLVGLVVLLTKKGNSLHKKLGTLFYFSLLLSSLLSLPMAIIHPNVFLFSIGVFTIYMLLSGKRYLKIKSYSDFNIFDKITTIVLSIFNIIFIIFGIYNIAKGNNFGFVFAFFGGLGSVFVLEDYKNSYQKNTIKNFGLIAHITRMVGSYIATLTAFLVVNNKVLPAILVWVLPTLIFVPLMVTWTKKYTLMKKNSI